MDEKSDTRDFSYLPPRALEAISEYVYDGVYIPIISNLTCGYKVSMLGIFLTEQQVIQALEEHFQVPNYTESLDEMIDYIYDILETNKNYFQLHILHFEHEIETIYNPYTYETKLLVPEDFSVSKTYTSLHELGLDDQFQIYKEYHNKYHRITHRTDADTLYVVLRYQDRIPVDRTARKRRAIGGAKFTGLVGLYTNEREVINAIISQVLNDLDSYLQQHGDNGPNNESTNQKLIRIQSYNITMRELDDFFHDYDDFKNYDRFAIHKYNIYMPDHMLTLPLDLTRRVNVIGRDNSEYEIDFFE